MKNPPLGYTFSPKNEQTMFFTLLLLDKWRKKYYSLCVNKLETFQVHTFGNVSNFGKQEMIPITGVEPGEKWGYFRCPWFTGLTTKSIMNKKE